MADDAFIENLVIAQGAKFFHEFEWKTDGVLEPLVGYTAKMQIRRSIESDDVLVELSTANSRIELESPGVIQLTIGASITSTFDPSIYAVYDLFLRKDADDITKLVKGAVQIIGAVTRDD